MGQISESSFSRLPTTRLGWWAVVLAVVYSLMGIINNFVFMRLPADTPWRQTVLPWYGIAMLLIGLSPGVVGLIAIFRHRERSWLVWLTILQWVFTVIMVFGDFLLVH